MVRPLLNFDQVQSVLRSRSYAFAGLQTIPLDQIVGSEGRAHEFSRTFRPPAHLQARLQGVESDPARPIEVFQVDQVYFIRDGHHRVALASARGQATIQALVTRVTVRAPITPEMDQDEVLNHAALSHFLQETNLDSHCPESNFAGMSAELYDTLREHVQVHRYYLGTRYGRDFTLEESAASWHDLIYRPLLDIMTRHGVQSEFPRRSEPELYLWLTYHREQLRDRGEYRGDEEVARGLVRRFSERPWVGLYRRARRVWQAAWAAALEQPAPPNKKGPQAIGGGRPQEVLLNPS
ncbi:MAG: hypothetical protein U0931_30615 [Vulcanimicrobiota bacterium]